MSGSAISEHFTFTYTALPARVVFGEGTLAQVPAELARLGVTKPFVIASAKHPAIPGAVGLFTEAVMHTPVDVTLRALAQLEASGADGLVAIGGGSTIGLAKALALRTQLSQLAVPTTYAGSEATPVLGQTEDGVKTTLRDLSLLPRTIVYDIALTLGLPIGLTVTSGINAMAHAVEATYAPDRNPVISSLAAQSLISLHMALPALVADPANRDARASALYGAWAAGTCLGSVGMGLHHKLCHVLGGSFGLPHSETHAVMLPYALAYNMPALSSDVRMAIVTSTNRSSLDAHADDLRALCESLGAPTSLGSLGLSAAAIDRATDLAMAAQYPNPRPLERGAIRDLLVAAQAGTWPPPASVTR